MPYTYINRSHQRSKREKSESLGVCNLKMQNFAPAARVTSRHISVINKARLALCEISHTKKKCRVSCFRSFDNSVTRNVYFSVYIKIAHHNPCGYRIVFVLYCIVFVFHVVDHFYNTMANAILRSSVRKKLKSRTVNTLTYKQFAFAPVTFIQLSQYLVIQHRHAASSTGDPSAHI